MKIAAAEALAKLARSPVPEVVLKAYKNENLEFCRDYIIPTPFDPRLIHEVSLAVAKAAVESGVAHHKITDWNKYADSLKKRGAHIN